MINNTLDAIHRKISAATMLDQVNSLDQKSLYGDKAAYLDGGQAFYIRLQGLQLHLKNETLRDFEDAIRRGDADRLHTLSAEIRQDLDRIYQANRPFQKLKLPVIILLSIAVVVAGILSFSSFKKKYSREKERYTVAANEERFKELIYTDMLQLKKALDSFYKDNRSYPKSSGGFDAIISNYGESKKEWIPGLAPKYIGQLPNDPRKSRDASNQYMYKSDGIEFKLLAHHPLGMSEVVANHPELVDPVRPSWAFGFWTEGAKNW
jgi:hypothetical protein